MGNDIKELIAEAIKQARNVRPSREMSLVITKLEEALLWYEQDEKPKLKQYQEEEESFDIQTEDEFYQQKKEELAKTRDAPEEWEEQPSNRELQEKINEIIDHLNQQEEIWRRKVK